MEPVGGQLRLRPVETARECEALALLRSQIHQVHQLLDENVVAAMDRARTAPSRQREILSLYAHALCVEDATVNLLLRAMQPVFRHAWTGGRLAPWNLTTLQIYAEVVHAGTKDLLARLTPADLRTPIDLSDAGLGGPDAAWVLNRFILWETAMTCGEIVAQRRATGLRGVRRRAHVSQEAAAPNGVYQPSWTSANGVVSAKPSSVQA